MSWKGRKGKECKVITYCDFGDPNRKDELCRHRDWGTARRRFPKIYKIYKTYGKCWQEALWEDDDE